MTTKQAMEFESFWDLAYRDGDHLEHWESPHPSQELAALVAAGLLVQGCAVLDIGCGAGRDTIFLAQCGFHAIGVDLSVEALKIARQRSEAAALAVEWHLADARHLPLGDATVDFVSDRGCFHTIEREDRRRFAGEVDRVLGSGGSVMIRGAARDCEEEGLVAVDAEEIDRCFPEQRFERGPLVPFFLTAPAGDLEGRVVVLRKHARD
jgi:SAM-dependent methyltransferase